MGQCAGPAQPTSIPARHATLNTSHILYLIATWFPNGKPKGAPAASLTREQTGTKCSSEPQVTVASDPQRKKNNTDCAILEYTSGKMCSWNGRTIRRAVAQLDHYDPHDTLSRLLRLRLERFVVMAVGGIVPRSNAAAITSAGRSR